MHWEGQRSESGVLFHWAVQRDAAVVRSEWTARTEAGAEFSGGWWRLR